MTSYYTSADPSLVCEEIGTMATLGPLEEERSELGYKLVEVREGRQLRVIHRACDASDVCLFFVHGGGGRAGQFKHLIKAFESTVNIVAFDFLGHGESPRPHQSELYTTNEHLHDLNAVYNMYKLHHNVFISHCYGAIHTLRLLDVLSKEKAIDGVAAVVLLDLGINAAASLGLVGKLPAFVLEWLRPLARSSSNAALFTPKTDPALISFENTHSNNNRMYVMKVVGNDCSSQETWSEWLDKGKQALKAAKIPRMLISGDSDGIFSVESVTQVKDLLEVPDNSFHIVKEAGHLPMLEKPEEVVQVVRTFLCNQTTCLLCIPKTEVSENALIKGDSHGTEPQ